MDKAPTNCGNTVGACAQNLVKQTAQHSAPEFSAQRTNFLRATVCTISALRLAMRKLSTTSQASSQQQLFYLIYFKNKTKSFEEIVMGVESWKSVRLARHFATFGEEQEAALFPSISTVLDTR